MPTRWRVRWENGRWCAPLETRAKLNTFFFSCLLFFPWENGRWCAPLETRAKLNTFFFFFFFFFFYYFPLRKRPVVWPQRKPVLYYYNIIIAALQERVLYSIPIFFSLFFPRENGRYYHLFLVFSSFSSFFFFPERTAGMTNTPWGLWGLKKISFLNFFFPLPILHGVSGG